MRPSLFTLWTVGQRIQWIRGGSGKASESWVSVKCEVSRLIEPVNDQDKLGASLDYRAGTVLECPGESESLRRSLRMNRGDSRHK